MKNTISAILKLIAILIIIGATIITVTDMMSK